MLECPVCHNKLEWSIIEQNGDRIEAAEARCSACNAAYPVLDGIGLFLTPELPRNDMWNEVDSGVIHHLREHPELERQLMEVPLDTLAPADQFFRAMVLDERGEYAQAKAASDLAMLGLYTSEYLSCASRAIA